jgi:hypothetical protein
VEHVAKETTAGFKGCKEWWAERRKAIGEKREVESRISNAAEGNAAEGNAAEVEMSRARKRARAFFQTLFPGEEPLSYS